MFRTNILLAAASITISSGGAQGEESIPLQRAVVNTADDPESVNTRLRLVEAYLRAGHREMGQAVIAELYSDLEALAKANPESARTRYTLGLCSLFRGDKDDAENEFSKAIELDPDLELASIGLAKLYADKGSFYRATATIRKALDISPQSESLRRTLAELLDSNRKVEQAVELYQSLSNEFPEKYEYIERLFGLYVKTGDIESAKPLLDRLMEVGEISQVDHALRLTEMHLDTGNVREVPQLLQRVRRLEPSHPKLDGYFARYYRVLGEQSEERKDWSRAVLYFNRSLEISPDEVSTRQALGSAYLELEEFEAANEQFMSIMDTTPSDPEFYVDFARAQLGLGNANLAFQVIDQAYNSSESLGNLKAMGIFEKARLEMSDTLKELLDADRSRQNPESQNGE